MNAIVRFVTHRTLPQSLVSVVALLALSALVPATAGAAAAEDLATVTVENTVIRFAPSVDADSWVLQVTGSSGVVMRRQVSGARTGELVIPRIGDGALQAGHYTYSLSALRADGTTREVQAGGFNLAEGGVYIARAENAPVSEHGAASGAALRAGAAPFFDFLINDDLIVFGSTCIGFDCVNNETFNDSTLILKENNLRIMFDDTSVAASYPRNDWRLEANSNLNGGGNYFAIVDCGTSAPHSCGGVRSFMVEAGAPANALRVDSSGNVGMRTNNPVTEIHTVSGDTPTLRLQQSSSFGWAPQTWDVAGNETNWFVRDATNGSTLPLRIRPGAPSNMIYIRDTGVAMGHTSPDAQLHVDSTVAGRVGLIVDTTSSPTVPAAQIKFNGTDYINFIADGSHADAMRVLAFDNGSQPGPFIELRRNNNVSTPAPSSLVLSITSGARHSLWVDSSGNVRVENRIGVPNSAETSGVVVGTQTSWFGQKDDIEPWQFRGALQEVVDLPLFTYRFQHDSQRGDKLNHGLVVFEGDRDAWWVMNGGHNQTPVLDEANLFGFLIGAIKELDGQVGGLNAKVQEQARTIDDLTARVEELERALQQVLAAPHAAGGSR